MRRAIAAAVMGGLVLGGVVVPQAFAARPGAGKAPAAAAQATRTVVFGGYEFEVPASWPVYRLDEYPRTCVRYDIDAVYLGTPGTNMDCLAGLVGRAETVSVVPGRGAAAGPGGVSPSGTALGGGAEVKPLPAVHAAITQDSTRHNLEVDLGAAVPSATVIGTYGANPAAVEQVLSTLRPAPAGAAPTAQTATASPTATATAPPAPAPAPTRKPAPAPTQPKPVAAVGGFDACTAPPLSTMRVFRGDYAAVGIYIGGVNYACAYGNLSTSWVRSAAGMGWGMLPTYVGPQSPCWAGHGVLIKPASAAAEGKAAAVDAVNDARMFGFPARSPLYYDMEAYAGSASCTQAVLAFLGAWDHQVNLAGYVTGVYSSQDSGIDDLQAAVAHKMPGFTRPDTIWIALWDGVPSLSDGTLAWPVDDRAKQYLGNVTATFGGISLRVDKDIVAGPVAR